MSGSASPAGSRRAELARKTCVVTGAGRGIGRAIATSLAESGAQLVLCSRTAAEVESVAVSLFEQFGTESLVAETDVSDRDAVRALALRAESRFGPADVLVNNAGVLGPVGPFVELDLDEWSRTIAIDLLGPAYATAAFAPRMMAAGRGRIVNVAGGGIGGPSVAPRLSAYTTAKMALVALTESLARELAPTVQVNAIAPGAIATDFVGGIVDAGPDVAGEGLYENTLRKQAAPDSIERFLELLHFVLVPGSSWLTGRLLSARWETPESVWARRTVIEGSSLYTLRRIDDTLFKESAPSN